MGSTISKPVSPFDNILFLHKAMGNRAVQRLIKSGALQTKLTVRKPNDIYEQEADRVAEQVMRMPDLSKAQSKGVSEYNKSPSVRKVYTKCEGGLKDAFRVQTAIQRETKTALQKEGWKNEAYVKDSTAAAIDAALNESKILSPYIKDKLKKSSVSGKKFVVHDSDAEFLSAYQKSYDVTIAVGDEKAFFSETWGFYDPKKDTIHLRPTSRKAHALHEAIHKLSDFSNGKSYFFRIFGSSALNEGVTQYFTDLVLQEQKMGVSKSHKYGKQLACAKELVDKYGFDLVAKAYFLGDLALPRKMDMKHREFVPKYCKDID